MSLPKGAAKDLQSLSLPKGNPSHKSFCAVASKFLMINKLHN